jgi:hypothetical protein
MPSNEPPFSDDEFRRRQGESGRPLEDILADLEKRFPTSEKKEPPDDRRLGE